jgi:hypothetical protein
VHGFAVARPRGRAVYEWLVRSMRQPSNLLSAVIIKPISVGSLPPVLRVAAVRGGWGDGRVARYDAVLGMAEGNGSPPEERVCVTKLLSLEIAYT